MTEVSNGYGTTRHTDEAAELIALLGYVEPDPSLAVIDLTRLPDTRPESGPVGVPEVGPELPVDLEPVESEPVDLQPVETEPVETEALVDDERPPPARRSRRAIVLGAVAVLAIVGLLAGLVITTLSLRHQQSLNKLRSSALSTARSDAVALTSYDYRTLDRDFAAVTNNSTKTFAANFTKTSAGLSAVFKQYHASSQATVLGAGITSVNSHKAVAVVFVNQVAKNDTQKSGTVTDQSRVELTLTRSHGKWLLDNVRLV